MHACFHGGGGGSGRTRTINIIRDLTKNMKAMSLKVKPGGGGGKARARRRQRRGSGADAEEDLEMQDKDVAAASASASAKIAPEDERGGKRQAQCHKCRSSLDDVAEELEEEGEAEATAAAEAGVADRAAGEEGDGEWVAEPEPGVLMTLVPRPDGTNHLRKLRFREELFDGPRAAQRWWADNYDSIVELYSIVQSTSGGSHNDDGDGAVELEGDEPATPCQSEDDHHQPRRWQRLGCENSASTSGGPSSGSGSGSGGGSASTVGSPILGLVVATPDSSKIGGGPGHAQSHKHKCRSLHIN